MRSTVGKQLAPRLPFRRRFGQIVTFPSGICMTSRENATDEHASHAKVATDPLENYFAMHGLESAEIVPETLRTASSHGNGVIYVKTIIFQAKGRPFAAVLSEDLVADANRLALHFGVPKRQVTLAGPTFVEELTGFGVGTIPPVGHRTRIPILVDKGLLQHKTIVGGSGRREFDSRLSVDDLLKATRADVVEMARPRSEQGVRIAGNAGGLGEGSGGKAKTKKHVVGLDDTPAFRRSPSRTVAAHGAISNSSGGMASGDVERRLSSSTDIKASRFAVARGEGVAAPHVSDGYGLEGEDGGGKGIVGGGRCSLPVGSKGQAMEAAAIDTEEDAPSPEEAKLRVIAAAMRVVAVALSALSSVPGSATMTNADGDEGEEDVRGSKAWPSSRATDEATSGRRENSGESRMQSSTPAPAGADLADERESKEVGASLEGSSATARPLRDNYTIVENSGFPDPTGEAEGLPSAAQSQYENTVQAEVKATAMGSVGAAGASIGAVDGARNHVQNGARNDATSETAAEMVGGGAGPPRSFGSELARRAGTPTVDAIGGDVHLVAVIASKRSLTRLLHFVDLVPPAESLPKSTHHSCRVRRSWIVPGMVSSSPPRPVQVQLIMGKTLVSRLGVQDAREVMRGVKRGQLVYVTGRPTPETYRRFVGAGDGTECIDAGMFRTEREEDANNADTYDLVCCSLRVLEEAPVVEEELVGKGDDWEDDEGEFLRMDLPDAAVTYVDTAEGLNEMGEYLRETLQTNSVSTLSRAVALDCEWRPTRQVGESRNPVCLLQLAAGERTFSVDMLFVCRPRADVAAALAAGRAGSAVLPGLTTLEALLEEALAGVLSATGVVKVGLGPKTDFLRLVLSYPHLPCLRRVYSVVDLSDVARNASSLRGKPAEEKGSLSRLSALVLGKRLDKSEQCSDWGVRPLSGRQKRYAALDARATLLIYRTLAPEVPVLRMESLIGTYTFDHRDFRAVFASRQKNNTGEREVTLSKTRPSSRTGRVRGGAPQQQTARTKARGISFFNVSAAPLDMDGLRQRWLGKALLPDLTKEGVVRTCVDPHQHGLGSDAVRQVLRFNRHQSFVEFSNGFALLMNCGGASKQRQHARFLVENGSLATWYLHGTLSSSDSATPGAGGGLEEDAVGRFLQRLADASDTSSSILGGLPSDELLNFYTAAASGGGRTAMLTGGAQRNGTVGSGSAPVGEAGEGGAGFTEEKDVQSRTIVELPYLVLFARAKGRPFVYCGEVDCVKQEYVSSDESTRLGAVRLTLALREWREAAAAAVAAAASSSSANPSGEGKFRPERLSVEEVDRHRKGDEFRQIREENQVDEEVDDFGAVVREGLRPLPLVEHPTGDR